MSIQEAISHVECLRSIYRFPENIEDGLEALQTVLEKGGEFNKCFLDSIYLHLKDLPSDSTEGMLSLHSDRNPVLQSLHWAYVNTVRIEETMCKISYGSEDLPLIYVRTLQTYILALAERSDDSNVSICTTVNILLFTLWTVFTLGHFVSPYI